MENKKFNWIFSKEELQNTPSRKCGIDAEKELAYRQQAASMIQDMGQRLQVNQLCINTALVYMHRFYMFHSFTKFHRNMMGPACIFLAAKVEEQPRKLEHVLKERHRCLCRDGPIFDNKSDAYLEQAQELVVCENILLQTLGFDITVDHPHTHVVKTCQLVRASKDFAQTSYFLATNSLHLTTMCLQYPPTVVACVCIHLASKWADYQINTSKEGKEWYWYINKTVTMELLEELANDFLTIVDKCPEKLKKSIMAKVTKRGISEKEEEQPAKKRVRTEPSATVSSAASTSSEGKAVHSTKISDELDLHSLLSMKALEMQRIEMSPIRHGVALAQSCMTQGNMLPVTVEPTHMQAVTFPSPVNEPIMMPLPVENLKQEKVAPLPSAPEKLSLRDYRQRIEQRPPPLALLPASATDKQDVAKTMSQHVMLKEAKVLVHDMQHSQGHDKLIFTTAQHAYDASRKRQNSGSHSDSEKRRHHHHHHNHHHPLLHGGQEVNQRDETEHRQTRVEENAVAGGRELEGKSSLKVHIKRESSGAHHIHHSSSSPLKLKIKRDPETATMHAASDGGKAERDREKKESLKLRLPINSTGRGDSDKHSRNKGHDGSSAQTPQKLTILMGSGTGSASSSGGVVVSSTLNSNGHSDRKRSKHSRSHSQVVDQSLHHASSTRSLDSSLRQSSSSLTSAPPPPPPEPLPPSTSMNLSYISAMSSTYHPVSHHPPLQTQFSGFSLNDSFLEQLPENIFDTDNPSNVGDMNGLAYDAPQTPTAENFKQIMAQHKSRHHPRHHNSFHIPPHPLMYPVDNCYPQNPPLPPPLPPEPNPPPPPPPPPSH